MNPRHRHVCNSSSRGGRKAQASGFGTAPAVPEWVKARKTFLRLSVTNTPLPFHSVHRRSGSGAPASRQRERQALARESLRRAAATPMLSRGPEELFVA